MNDDAIFREAEFEEAALDKLRNSDEQRAGALQAGTRGKKPSSEAAPFFPGGVVDGDVVAVKGAYQRNIQQRSERQSFAGIRAKMRVDEARTARLQIGDA